MRISKQMLFCATALTVCASSAAQAQIALPAAELRGVGASSITNILVQSLNCVGNPGSHAPGNTDNLNRAGTNTGSLSAIPEGLFSPTTPTPTSPAFDCNLQEIQPDFQGKYVATGSGTGRSFWRAFSNQLPGTTSSNINPFGTWNNVQFAFSDAPATASDLAAYDSNANNTTNRAGAPIQFPLYVLPVALAYNPVYGRFISPTKGLISLSYRVRFPTRNGATITGGLPLSKAAYCGIFNGTITNFNDPIFTALNAGIPLRDANDGGARWANVGVPIRLVGRLDNSGTTDIFTRHLAVACDGQVPVNKFAQAAEALPFDRTSGINLSSFRSDTRYTPTSTGALAGTVQSLSGAVFVRASGNTPATINATQGAETAGLFMVADGSSGVRDAINFTRADPVRVGQVVLNGKIGYIGADFVAPAIGQALFSAALQVGTGSTFAAPTAANATAAFGNILPPQTTSNSGAYDENDPRTGPTRDGTGTQLVNRGNPLNWTSVLYSTTGESLDNPSTGYPITGTTQYLGYTCYASAATRLAVAEFLGLNFGKVSADSTNSPISLSLFRGTSPQVLGLLAQVGIAPMPIAWQSAIFSTFLRNTSGEVSNGTSLGSRNLWLQSNLPTTATQIDGNTANGEVIGSRSCVNGRGA